MRVVVIGVSAGGPETLKTLFQNVKELYVPVVIAQHNTTEDVEGFAKWLSSQIIWDVHTVKNEEVVKPSTLYIPSGGKDIVLADIDIVAVKEPNGVIAPSIDRLFMSAAKFLGNEVIAIILSGLGRDGVEGAKEVSECGGRVIVQQDAKFSHLPSLVAMEVTRSSKRDLLDIAMILESLR